MDLETRLDSEIAHIRSEIAKLRAHKQRLSSALLGSSRIQKHVSTRKRNAPHEASTVNAGSLEEKIEQAIEQQRQENDIKVHRLAFGVTAFPFTDSAPRSGHETGQSSMLGVRFDLHPTTEELDTRRQQEHDSNRDTLKQESETPDDPTTYVLLLRKLQHNNTTYLKVHHHNIPKHIDVELYEDKYLPLPSVLQEYYDDEVDAQNDQPNSNSENASRGDEDSFQDDSGIDLTITEDAQTQDNATLSSTNANIQGNNQSLHPFVTSVHSALRSWHYRVQSIASLRHSLGLQNIGNASLSNTTQPQAKFSVYTLEQKTHDARHAQIVWTNGTLGLLKINAAGFVERAIVYGPASPTSPHPQRTDIDSLSGSSDNSELSDLNSDEDSNLVHPMRQTQSHSNERRERQREDRDHVRLHNIERLLTRTENDDHVQVQGLAQQLLAIEKEFAL